MLPFQLTYESPTIDWGMLARAQAYYKTLGYRHIEVPWMIEPQATRQTWASEEGVYRVFSAAKGASEAACDLPGSAEQSFLQLAMLNALAPGRYQTITPCYRDEPVVDLHHQKHFMKLELFVLLDKPVAIGTGADAQLNTQVRGVMKDACDFFANQGAEEHNYSLKPKHPRAVLRAVEDKAAKRPAGCFSTYDVMLGDVEIGSYGAAVSSTRAWVYGTGLAEPRFSRTLMHAQL